MIHATNALAVSVTSAAIFISFTFTRRGVDNVDVDVDVDRLFFYSFLYALE